MKKCFFTEIDAIKYFEYLGDTVSDDFLEKYKISYGSMPSNKNGGIVWVVWTDPR